MNRFQSNDKKNSPLNSNEKNNQNQGIPMNASNEKQVIDPKKNEIDSGKPDINPIALEGENGKPKEGAVVPFNGDVPQGIQQ